MSAEADQPEPRTAVNPLVGTLVWLWVLVPFGYGLGQLVIKIPALFGS